MSNRSKKKRLEEKQADRWEVGVCAGGHTVLHLFDRSRKAFAQAHGFNPDALALAVLAGGNEPCSQCIVERLEEMLKRVKSALSSAERAGITK
jgi:hypothetical protein